MSILKLKDKNNVVHNVPAIQGDSGSLIISQNDKEEMIVNTFDLMPQAEELLLWVKELQFN